MINTQQFVGAFRDRGVKLFTGVPDSLLQSFSACLMQTSDARQHIIAANEGNAIALAMGHYMASGSPAVVYMQNSGIGNAINPITSLADPEVYGIPMILIVGWRGEPGHKDEPQHIKQGRITEQQLELLEIPHWIIDRDSSAQAVIEVAWQAMTSRNGPVALLVRSGTLTDVKYEPTAGLATSSEEVSSLHREAAIGRILDLLYPQDIVVATTGKTGREVFELRAMRGEAQRDFLSVGGMGHTASIALGICLAQSHRRVICLDGDGSMLMHLGATAITGDLKPSNMIHILLNNKAHESVGGQPTVAGRMDFAKISAGCGYAGYHSAAELDELSAIFQVLRPNTGPHLIEIHLCQGSRKDLGRPTSTPQQNKVAFMDHLKAYN